jgi:AcrR family transcriptional regulator
MNSDSISTAERPLRADARRNREKIVVAARAAFAESGLDAQMDDVAAKAGVGVGTIYRHFPTKDALVRAVIVHKMNGLAELGRRHLDAGGDPWETLRAFLWEAADVHVKDRALAQVLSTQPSSTFRQIALEETELGQTSGALIARAQEAGVVRKDVGGEDIGLIMCGLAAILESGWGDTAWRRYLTLMEQSLTVVDGDPLPD